GNNLYENDGAAFFEDASIRTGLGPASHGRTGFGTSWFDMDNDGWLDLLAVNGAIEAIDGRGDHPFPYDETNLLFRNLRNGRFENVTDRAGASLRLSEISRGAAFGDIDNDGDTDVVVSNNSGRARLFVNGVGDRNHWLGLRLTGRDAPRDMLGARVAVMRAGEAIWRHVRTDGSYASAHDPRVLVGLGRPAQTPLVRVLWPSGRVEEWNDLPIDGYTTLAEGTGTVP
ncbi:MAG: CRTAC1 family protein, partial [Acidobacteria bacterium]|nr:CRTAC1 family protein [Acidobacteriota bacterium]